MCRPNPSVQAPTRAGPAWTIRAPTRAGASGACRRGRMSPVPTRAGAKKPGFLRPGAYEGGRRHRDEPSGPDGPAGPAGPPRQDSYNDGYEEDDRFVPGLGGPRYRDDQDGYDEHGGDDGDDGGRRRGRGSRRRRQQAPPVALDRPADRGRGHPHPADRRRRLRVRPVHGQIPPRRLRGWRHGPGDRPGAVRPDGHSGRPAAGHAGRGQEPPRVRAGRRAQHGLPRPGARLLPDA